MCRVNFVSPYARLLHRYMTTEYAEVREVGHAFGVTLERGDASREGRVRYTVLDVDRVCDGVAPVCGGKVCS